MELLLINEDWELKGFYPWVPLKETSMETGQKLHGVTDWIPATVPGGVHYDLYRAGWIEYPYKDLNSLKCEWVENRWWIYRTYFELPDLNNEQIELTFKGLDYQAVIYLNGEELGEHQGMYHPAKFDITSVINTEEKQELLVLFKGVPEEMGQIGKTSLTHTQKSRFNYKWDFSTRMVNIGIWDDVFIKIKKSFSLEEIKLYTDLLNGKGNLEIDLEVRQNTMPANGANLEELRLELELYNPDQELDIKKEVDISLDQSGQQMIKKENNNRFIEFNKILLELDNPLPWYPNGYGEQPLYHLKVNLLDGNSLIDSKEFDTGFRNLRYQQNENSPGDALPYTIVINDEPIYIKGVNITPLDHLYGNVTPAHYEYLIRLMKKANINLVRVWGGGLIEKEAFYDLCDRYGILVWQDFIQSSSGIDNIPSKLSEFIELIEKTAVYALKEKRNHVSLSVWCGGNELMSEPNKPSTYQDTNIALLKRLVEKYDPQRLFLPTSASGPVEFVTKKKGISHDIHGHWHYLGNPKHYEMYGQSDSLFHSEFGVDGVSSMKTFKKILSKEHHYPTPMSGNMVWRHHGEYWGTFFRDEKIFGELNDIEDFVKCSQWVQAEGLRYILEANRRRKFENSGSIIWQLNEPWPNTSCTNLVEYYGDTKMAYYWMKEAFAPVSATMDYRKLNYSIGEEFNASIFCVSNQHTGPVSIIAEVLNNQGSILYKAKYQGSIYKNESQQQGRLSFKIDSKYKGMFYIRLKLYNEDKLLDSSIYYFSTQTEQVYKPAMELDTVRLSIQPIDEWQEIQSGYNFKDPTLVRNYLIENIDSKAALHIYPEEISNAYYLEADQAYFTLFPGEKNTIKLECLKKQSDGFLSGDQPNPINPQIVLKWFNR